MPQDLRRGAIYAVLAAAMLAVAATCIKAATPSVGNGVIVFARSSLGLLLMLPWLIHHGRAALRTTRLGGHLLRAGFGVVSMYCYFYAIGKLPLAEAVLLTYTMPLFSPFIAWAWLGERPPAASLPAALVGLLGITLIVKPDAQGFASWPALIGAFSGLSAAAAMVSIRRISATEPPSRVVFYFLLLATVVTTAPLPWLWQTPPASSWPLLLGVGLFATLGQICLTRAYSSAPAARIGPFTYSSVIFAGALGWLIWDERPTLSTAFGIALVIGSCVLALWPSKPIPEAAAVEL